MWIVNEERSQAELAASFKAHMNHPALFQIPGVHDGMSALYAKKMGFLGLYLSGAAFCASKGLPDLGMIHSTEMAEKAKEIIRASELPLLVDIDTGYGGVLNTARAAKEMVESKVAAIQIEDQQMPKKCGHLNGKSLVPAEEMIAKIKAIKQVAPSLLVVARTDAKSVSGMDDVIHRANLYVEAGADAIFPEALTTTDDFMYASNHIRGPLLANMTEFGQTPYYHADEFSEFGFDMVIYPVSTLRVAAKGYERLFTEIKEKGTQQGMLQDMQTRKELYEAIHYDEYEEMDQKIAKTILPEIGKEHP
ncbi:methylisocitrate lyase [Bacillus sp. 179-C3.3 HS]|uniref:methylisocitrate lyase n=1 Tax=Bacillus sp. 179-C3.3 HS TaxID=3232162 RepID=UPI0039A06FEF